MYGTNIIIKILIPYYLQQEFDILYKVKTSFLYKKY